MTTNESLLEFTKQLKALVHRDLTDTDMTSALIEETVRLRIQQECVDGGEFAVTHVAAAFGINMHDVVQGATKLFAEFQPEYLKAINQK